jgi:hypothetical protein
VTDSAPPDRPAARSPRSREDLVDEVHSLATRLGTSKISKLLFRRETGIGESEVRKHFDSWNELVAAAGLTPTDMSRLPDDVLFAEMRDVFLAQGRVTTQLRFGKLARYNVTTYRRFGAWPRVLSAFHDWLIATGQDFPLIGELPAEPNDPVTTPEIAPPGTSDVHSIRGTATGTGRRYGPFLSFRGLQHEPINEQGVVLLFGMVAHELGFVVESVHTGFPDCEAKRRVGRLWERSRIEFEFESRNFERHGHDPTGCDLIVCWHHNWPEAPVDVLQLRTAIQGLDP